MPENPQKSIDGPAYRAALYIAFVSGFFSLLFIFFMAANFVSLKESNPLNLATLAEMRADSWENPGDEELKGKIRELDLAARKAFYSGLVFSRTGACLLLSSLALFVFSLKYVLYARSRLVPVPAIRMTADGRNSLAWIYPSAAALLILAASWNVIYRYGLKKHPDFAKIAAEGVKNEGPAGKKAAVPSHKPVPSDEEIMANWPQFRGPLGRSRSNAKNLPVKWDAVKGEGVLWKLELPLPGNNSPVLWGGNIYLLGADKTSKALWCVNAASGALSWKTEIKIMCGSGTGPEVFEDTSFAPSTIATDGRVICAVFPDGFVASFDMDGKQLWYKFFGSPESPYGHASSPIIFGDNVIVQFDHAKDDMLCAYYVFTGDEKWKQPREMDPSWATPLIVKDAGRTQLVVSAAPKIVSYDPMNGAENWSAECSMNDLTISPSSAKGMLFVPGKDAVLQALRIEGRKPAWELSENVPEVASPLATERFLFTANISGNISCYGLDDGKPLWSKDFGSGFYSSPVEAEGRIYATDITGVTHVFAEKEQFELIADNILGESCFTIPAFADGRIFIRGQKHLFSMGTK